MNNEGMADRIGSEPLSPEEERTFRARLAASNGPDDDVGYAVFGDPEDAEEWAARLLATLDAARSEPVPGLDVERLARAWHAYWHHGVEVPGDATDMEWAEAFAAEYAALSPTEAE